MVLQMCGLHFSLLWLYKHLLNLTQLHKKDKHKHMAL